MRQRKTVREQEVGYGWFPACIACGPHALILEKTHSEPHPKLYPAPVKAWSSLEHRCVQLCRWAAYSPASLLMRNSCSLGRRHLHVMLRNVGARLPAKPVVHYQPIMGEPSLVSQPPRAQHQNELLRAGEGVAGQLGAESAAVGFRLCVRHPLQGRRREA